MAMATGRAAAVGVLVAASAASVVLGQDGDEGLSSAELIEGVRASVVMVEHTFRYDNGEAPEMDLAGLAYRAAEGEMEADWSSLITQERPAERMGFVIAPDLVLTVDPLVHGRFIERVEVRDGDRRIGARAEAYAIEENAVLLRLDEPLAGAEALRFDVEAAGPFRAVSVRWGNGRWWLYAGPTDGQTIIGQPGPEYDVVPWPSLIVAADGTAVSACFDGGLEADGSWKRAPADWDWLSAEAMDATKERVAASADAALPRVELRFRSPSQSSPGGGRGYGAYAEELTEWNGTGILLDERRVLVLAKLEPKVTARLESARVHLADGREVAASFGGSLRDYAAIVVNMEESAGGAAVLSSATLHDVEDSLLVRSQVRVLGESRTSYQWQARLARMTRGFRGRLLGYFGDVSSGSIETGDGGEGPMSFLFGLDGELVALPLVVREKVTSQSDRGGWSRADYQETVLGASDLAEILGAGDAAYDPDNRPLSEAEENRLAWLGVELQAMDPDLARFNEIVDLTAGGTIGGIVTYVYADSPAARAGLEVGDILLRLHIEGHPRPLEVQVSPYDMGWGAQYLEALDQIDPEYYDQIPPPWGGAETALTRALTDVGFGTAFTADVFRGGRVLHPEFVVEEGPAHYGAAAKFKSGAAGLTVRNLTYEARRFFQLTAEDPGVIVSMVEQGEGAAVAGIKPFELIVAVNDRPVYSVGEFEAAISGGGELRLSIMRMHMGRLVKIRVPAGE